MTAEERARELLANTANLPEMERLRMRTVFVATETLWPNLDGDARMASAAYAFALFLSWCSGDLDRLAAIAAAEIAAHATTEEKA